MAISKVTFFSSTPVLASSPHPCPPSSFLSPPHLHPQVHLVTQHCEEFSRMLEGRWAITTLSGNMGPRPGFGHLARKNDLLICTAELLQMALVSPEEEEHVELNGEAPLRHPCLPNPGPHF